MNNSTDSGNSVYSLPKGKVFAGYEADNMYTNLYSGQENTFLKNPVNTLINTNITLPTYTGTDNTRVLLISQTNKIENGIYVVNNNILSRSADMTNGTSAAGSLIYVHNVNNYYTCICNYAADIVGINDLLFSNIFLTPYNLLGDGATEPVGLPTTIQYYKSDPSNHVDSSLYFNIDQSLNPRYRSAPGFKIILGKPSATTTITSDEDFYLNGDSKVQFLTGLSGNGSGSGDITINSSILEINTLTSNLLGIDLNINTDAIKISTNAYLGTLNPVNQLININGINFFNGMVLTKTNQTIPTIATVTSTDYQGKLIITDVTSVGPLDSVLIRVNNSNIIPGNQLIFLSASQNYNPLTIEGVPLVEVYNVQNGYYEIMLINIGTTSLPAIPLMIQYFIIKTI
jgi:hypothetical protein